jgi:5-methyltetrahydrofolate--homocysteine methyltransferase
VETILESPTRKVTIGPESPFVIIGERINPTGRKALAAEILQGNFDRVIADARSQVDAGAALLDVNAGVPGADEPALLIQLVEIVQKTTDVPVCIDSSVVAALEAALPRCQGKPLVNSVTGEEERMEAVLPLVRRHGAAVIGLAHDEAGPSMDPEERLRVARKIVARASDHGIAPEDVIIDPMAMTVGADPESARVTLETIRRVRQEMGNNLTLGASNISFGLPDRRVINAAFLALAMGAGLTSAIANPLAEGARPTVMAADLLLARDAYGMAWIQEHRKGK